MDDGYGYTHVIHGDFSNVERILGLVEEQEVATVDCGTHTATA